MCLVIHHTLSTQSYFMACKEFLSDARLELLSEPDGASALISSPPKLSDLSLCYPTQLRSPSPTSLLPGSRHHTQYDHTRISGLELASKLTLQRHGTYQQDITFLLLIPNNASGDCGDCQDASILCRICYSHCGLTYRAFSPVTGCVLTMGCSVMTGSLRTAPSFPFEALTCSTPEPRLDLRREYLLQLLGHQGCRGTLYQEVAAHTKHHCAMRLS